VTNWELSEVPLRENSCFWLLNESENYTKPYETISFEVVHCCSFCPWLPKWAALGVGGKEKGLGFKC